jgi:ubiquinone/menaquinone biosynthesis C-methylase UbiE
MEDIVPTARDDPTARALRVWDAVAPRYDRGMQFWDRTWFAGGRQWVASRAHGRVLEVAVGTGRNLDFYPADVTVTAVELSPAMLTITRQHATDLGRSIELHEADAQALPFADEDFDTVVCTLSLCTIPDPATAIGEMRRVLRAGGRLLLLDHIASSWWPIRAIQRLVEQLTIRAAGEHLTRRPLPLVRAAGFEVVEAQRLKAGTIERIHARKPAP